MTPNRLTVHSYDRPPCPACNMNMITTDRLEEGKKNERRVLHCLRCGHTETESGKRSNG